MLSKLHAQKSAQHCAVEVKVSCGGPIARHCFVHLLIATRREGRRRDGGRDWATEGGKDGETKGGRDGGREGGGKGREGGTQK